MGQLQVALLYGHFSARATVTNYFGRGANARKNRTQPKIEGEGDLHGNENSEWCGIVLLFTKTNLQESHIHTHIHDDFS